jgi:glycosyltransferase involved in cell wall biosynthesis
MAKLKLLHICATQKPGGAETFFLRTMVELNKVCDLHVVVRKKSWLSEELIRHGIKHHTLSFGRHFDFSTTPQLRKLIQDIQPDVVQAWMKRAAMFLPRTIVPTIGRLGGYYNLKYFQNCDVLVGNTEDICRFIKDKGWPEEDVKYLPNFAPKPTLAKAADAAKVRKKFKIDPKDSVIFMSGRLHEVKGIDTAIQAIAHLENTHLVLAGEGPEKDSLQEFAKSLNVEKRVHFAGWVTDLSPYAKAADIWLVASRHEPLGNTLLDAWWYKVPAITSRTDGPLSLAKDAETALFFDVGNVEELVKKIRLLQSDEESVKKLSVNGHAEVAKKYSAKALIPTYLDFYKKVVSCAE